MLKEQCIRNLFFFFSLFFNIFALICIVNINNKKNMIKSLCRHFQSVSLLHLSWTLSSSCAVRLLLLPAYGRSGRLWIYSGSCAWRKCRCPQAWQKWTSLWTEHLINKIRGFSPSPSQISYRLHIVIINTY